MRAFVAVVAVLAGLAGALAHPAAQGKIVKRFQVDFDPEAFPQDEPKKTVLSVVKAAREKKYDYLVAYLADPQFVDQKVAQHLKQLGGTAKDAAKVQQAFERLVKATAEHFEDDP